MNKDFYSKKKLSGQICPRNQKELDNQKFEFSTFCERKFYMNKKKSYNHKIL